MSGNDFRNAERDESSRREPSAEEIAARAYERYAARRQSGHEDRSPEEDWYEAERELREAPDTPPNGEEDGSANGSSEKRPRKVESFSPRPESAERTHAEPPEPEPMPPSFSPRPESAKTTRAAKKKPPAETAKGEIGTGTTTKK